MAEDESKKRNGNATADEDHRKAKDLKFLDFVKAAILYIIVFLASLYDCAKEKSGPLKPGIKALETSINFVVGPIYHKFHGTPFSLLQLLDHKVDESIHRMEQTAKKGQRTQAAGRGAASETHARFSPTAKEVYVKYEPVAIQYAVTAWQVMRWIPVIRQMIQVALPMVKYAVKVYNWTVRKARRKGYVGARYMPVVPLERIAKVFTAKS